MNTRPTSFLIVLLALMFTSTASATDAGPRAPAPVADAITKPVNERDRVLEILFEAECVRDHIPTAYQNKADINRLLAKHGFDEKRIKELVKRYHRLRDFKAQLKAREAQCTPTLARALYAGTN